jgi:hypothetical protein
MNKKYLAEGRKLGRVLINPRRRSGRGCLLYPYNSGAIADLTRGPTWAKRRHSGSVADERRLVN